MYRDLGSSFLWSTRSESWWRCTRTAWCEIGRRTYGQLAKSVLAIAIVVASALAFWLLCVVVAPSLVAVVVAVVIGIAVAFPLSVDIPCILLCLVLLRRNVFRCEGNDYLHAVWNLVSCPFHGTDGGLDRLLRWWSDEHGVGRSSAFACILLRFSGVGRNLDTAARRLLLIDLLCLHRLLFLSRDLPLDIRLLRRGAASDSTSRIDSGCSLRPTSCDRADRGCWLLGGGAG
mmetsp:Transcript_10353/g.28489  ORF Transcript_10353/g.28489 Transcript_10353/m.28489 type:complete len:231 (+) Transcript_10353:83-775(+)